MRDARINASLAAFEPACVNARHIAANGDTLFSWIARFNSVNCLTKGDANRLRQDGASHLGCCAQIANSRTRQWGSDGLELQIGSMKK